MVVGERQPARERGFANARQGASAVDELPVESCPRRRARVPGPRQRHAKRGHVRGVEAGRHVAQAGEALGHEARRCDEHECERYLGDDEQSARALLVGTAGRRTARFLEHGGDGDVAGAQQWYDAHGDGRDQRGRGGKQHDRGIEAYFAESGDVDATRQRREQVNAERGESESYCAAGAGEYDCLAQILRHQRGTSGAECVANGKFAVTPLRPHKEKIGDVGAGDGEHESHRRKQDPEQPADAADDHVAKGCDRRAEARLLEHSFRDTAGGVLVEQTRQKAAKIGDGGIDGDAGLEPRDGVVVEAQRAGMCRIELEWIPELGGGRRIPEAGRHDADDLPESTVDDDAPAKERRVGAILPSPECVREDHDARRVRAVVVGCERMPARRCDAERRHPTRADAGGGDSFGIPL